jgi:hypothetical protein
VVLDHRLVLFPRRSPKSELVDVAGVGNMLNILIKFVFLAPAVGIEPTTN